MSGHIDYTNPANCKLHAARLTGGLYYAPRSDGCYSMYAPSCTGCSIGLAENAMFTRRNKVSDFCFILRSSNTIENTRAALDAIAEMLINGDDLEANDARYSLKELLLIKDLMVPARHVGDSEIVSAAVSVAQSSPSDENKRAARGLIGRSVREGGLAHLVEAVAHLDSMLK